MQYHHRILIRYFWNMFQKLYEVSSAENRKFHKFWIERDFLPFLYLVRQNSTYKGFDRTRYFSEYIVVPSFLPDLSILLFFEQIIK